RLTRATYDHLAMMLVEMIRLPRVLHAHNVGRYVEYAGACDYDRAIGWVRSGRPLLVLTGHFGNWEGLSYVMGLLAFRAPPATRSAAAGTTRPWTASSPASARRRGSASSTRAATTTASSGCWPAAATWGWWATRTPGRAACSSSSSAGRRPRSNRSRC